MSIEHDASTISGSQLIHQLNWRYATKKFDASRKISAADWETLEKSLLLAPSSFGLQPWHFVVVQDPALRTELRKASWNQPQIEEASHLVVIASKKEVGTKEIEQLIARIGEVRGVPKDALKEYQGMMMGFLVPPAAGLNVENWAARQTYLALGVLLTSAAVMGIDACPMEGIDANKYDQLLGLASEGYGTICVTTLGYRSAEDKNAGLTKVRYSQDEVISHR